MNILPFEKQVAAISALTEGVSIRATERLTGIHRDTIMRLGVRVGEGCWQLHDSLFRDLQVSHIELDEVWAFVAKKQRRVTQTDGSDVGDQYLFTALDAIGKAIITYVVGKRTSENTQTFVADLRKRVINRPTISSDGFNAYPESIELAFGADCDYGQIVKQYHGEPSPEAARRYSPGHVVRGTSGKDKREPETDLHIVCRAIEFDREDAVQALHPIEQRVQQKATEPRGGDLSICRALQSDARPRNATDHAGHGFGRHRSHLDDCGTDRSGA